MNKPSINIARGTVLFVAGLLGVAHETLIGKAERPSLLLIFGAMIGLPAFISKDKKDVEK